ncbi:MAG: glyoxalase/bleomycin resistance/dioxygenase family protein [Acidimicrobiaceae bacterium]|nr:glyoxalase/bleomycin resistance/dioxygenase family protein [Acidimicrobiaceae bacterium]
MSRVQLALNVSNLGEAIDFYSRFFDASPAKVRPGYANFAIDDPPLKLVLIEGGGEPGSINHLGVEALSSAEVAEAKRRLGVAGLASDDLERTTCCYAVQDKFWVQGPDTSRWEHYTVLEDVSDEVSDERDQCCVGTTATQPVAGACC